MMSIGEFSRLSGQTVKALHHYDERGVLVPADVDPQTRYRSYSAAQLRQASILKALRDAGVPLAEMPASLCAVTADGPESGRESPAVTLLDDHRRRLLLQREAEDAAAGQARLVLAGLSRPVAVDVRQATAQPYVGVVMTLDAIEPAPELSDDDANAAFAALFSALAVEGLAPSGAYWTTLRTAASLTEVELVLCWPLERELPASWELPGQQVEHGVLPVRTEVFARVDHDGELAEDGLHPGVICLLEAIEERGLTDGVDLARLRQVGVMDEAGNSTGTELVYALT